MIRVLLIYDSALVRDALRALLASSGGFDVVADAGTLEEGMAQLAACRPDVVLMDVSQRILDAIDASAVMRRELPRAAIVMLCRHCGGQPCFRPLPHHADLLLSKTRTDGRQLVDAIRGAWARKAGGGDAPGPLPAHAAWCGITAWATLSAREREVLKMVADGRTSAEIARMVKLSPKTVQTYRARIMSKLKVRGLPGLIKYAVQYGLTPLR